MMKGRFNYPDLDVLDSPLLSPAPFTAGFANVPASAIAERIFHDPASWGDDDEDDGDFPENVDDDQLGAWLTEEVDKVRTKVAGYELLDSIPISIHKAGEKGTSLTDLPVSAVSPLLQATLKRDSSIAWKGLSKRGGAVRPISLAALFEHSTDDFSGEIQQQLSRILESGGIPYHIRYPHSSALSPPSTSGTSSTLDSPLQIQTASSAGSGGDNSVSPVTIYSASATLSFLEWYGIYPDTPRFDLIRQRSAKLPKSARLKAPVLQMPSPRRASRPTSLLDTPLAETPKGRPGKRASSVPPPGLDIPVEIAPEARSTTPPPAVTRSTTPPAPPLRRSPSPIRAAVQPVREPATSVARPTHIRSASESTERKRSADTPPPPSYAAAQLLQRSGSAPSRRRLPTIPPEGGSGASSRASTPPVQAAPAHVNAPALRASSRNPSPAPSTTTSIASAMFSPPSNCTQIGPRPPSSIRSPQGGPAGPRTRGRGSRDSAGQPGIAVTMGHRPPVLRL